MQEMQIRSHPHVIPERMLVPVEGTPVDHRLVTFAAALGAPAGARATLVRVVEDATELGSERHLERLADHLRRAGVQPDTLVLEGRPASRIMQLAEERDVGTMVLPSPTPGRGALLSFGTTAHKLLQNASSSMLIVPARFPVPTDGYRKLFVPLDGSLRGECVLPLVRLLAREHEARVVLCRVVPTEAADAYLEPIARDLRGRGLDVRTRVEVSHRVSSTLTAVALEEGCDLAVLSAHGETGDPEERHGDVAFHFLRAARLPTLVVQDMRDQLSTEACAAPASR